MRDRIGERGHPNHSSHDDEPGQPNIVKAGVIAKASSKTPVAHTPDQ